MEIASNREGYACDFCFYRTTQQEGFDFRWADVFCVWKIYLIFFIPFLIHNFFIAPLLVYRHRSGLFFFLQTTLLTIFFATQHAIKEQGNTGKKMENATCYALIQNVTTSRQGTNNHAKCLINPHQYPPTLFQQTDIVYTFILFLMHGMNTSIKFYFKEKEDRERIDARRRKLPYSTPLVLHLCRQRFQAWHHLPKALLHQRKDRDRKHNTPALQQ